MQSSTVSTAWPPASARQEPVRWASRMTFASSLCTQLQLRAGCRPRNRRRNGNGAYVSVRSVGDGLEQTTEPSRPRSGRTRNRGCPGDGITRWPDEQYGVECSACRSSVDGDLPIASPPPSPGTRTLTGGGYPFGSRGMSAATGRAERSESLGFPRDCITPVATACVSSPGTRTLTGAGRQGRAWCGLVASDLEVNLLAVCLRTLSAG